LRVNNYPSITIIAQEIGAEWLNVSAHPRQQMWDGEWADTVRYLLLYTHM